MSFISEPDDGIYHAMNKGLILSESCYIYYLNSGDVLNKDIDLLSVLEQFSNYDCITFPVLQYFGKDSYLRPSRRKPIASITSSDISHQGIVVKLEIPKSFPFDIDLPVSADSLWMRKIMNSNNFYFHNSILCHFELGGISNNFSFSNAVKLISSNSSLSYRLKVVVKMIFQSILGQRLFYRIFYFFKYDHTIRK